MILLVASFLSKFHKNKYVNGAFYGLRPASSAMITAAGLILARVVFFGGNFSNPLNVKAVILAAVLLVLTHAVKFTEKLHPTVWIALSAAAGVIFKF